MFTEAHCESTTVILKEYLKRITTSCGLHFGENTKQVKQIKRINNSLGSVS